MQKLSDFIVRARWYLLLAMTVIVLIAMPDIPAVRWFIVVAATAGTAAFLYRQRPRGQVDEKGRVAGPRGKFYSEEYYDDVKRRELEREERERLKKLLGESDDG